MGLDISTSNSRWEAIAAVRQALQIGVEETKAGMQLASGCTPHFVDTLRAGVIKHGMQRGPVTHGGLAHPLVVLGAGLGPQETRQAVEAYFRILNQSCDLAV